MLRRSLVVLTLTLIAVSASVLASEPPGAALLEDATSYAAQAGVSVDEGVRRLRLQQEIGDLDAALAADESETYAGLWIDDKNGYRVVARFTDPAAEARLRARVAGGRLAGLMETRSARWSLAELRQLRNEVRGHAKRGKIRTNSDINVFENRAEIYVLDDESKLHAAMAKSGARVPDGVVVRRVPRLAEPAAALNGGATLSTCTAGFTVQAPNEELGILTAGHCDNYQYAQGVLLPFRIGKKGGELDVQWHSVCDLFQVSNQFESGLGLRSVVGTRPRIAQATGSFVCKWGKATRRTCGWITSREYDPEGLFDFNPMDGTFMRVNGRGANLVDSGDSGGPWFVEGVAYGITSGTTPANLVGVILGDEDAVYMAINYVSGIGVSVLTSDPGPCNFPPLANFTGGVGKTGSTASFNASTSSDPDGSIVRYEWDFDDGTTGVSITPSMTHVYPSGTNAYWVMLTVTDNEGKRASTSREVCVPTILCISPLP